MNELQSIFPVTIAAELSGETGVPIFLVGGAVRDSLLGGGRSGDCDFAVAGQLDEIVRRFSRRVRGQAIPWDANQVRIVYRDKTKQHVTVDFALIKGGSIDDDLLLRDFTVNAMAVDVGALHAGAPAPIIDPQNGRTDLGDKIIRLCSDHAFEDDPLRMLRAVRFARQLGFSIEERILDLCKKQHGLLGQVSVERIKKEFFTTLNFPGAALSLRQLLQAGLLQELLPEVERWLTFEQCPPHEHRLLEHCLKTVEFLDDEILRSAEPLRAHLAEAVEEGVTRRALALFAALVHDSGKPDAARDVEGRRVFHGHDALGSHLNYDICRRLGLGRRASRMVELTTAGHMRLLQLTLLETATERAKLRLVRDCSEAAAEVVLLALADMRATTADAAYRGQLEKARGLAAGLLELALEPDAAKGSPLLTGADIMAELGLAPGPEVGAALARLAQAERDGLIQTRDEALQWLKTDKP